jgi:putative tryptophan/tyrosine transport system substrate-binding protein
MRRRDFLTLFGGFAAAWPLEARAQQRAMPVIGFLGTVAQGVWAKPVAAFEEQLREHGWIDGRTIKIIYRWAEGRLAAKATQMSDELYSSFAALP